MSFFASKLCHRPKRCSRNQFASGAARALASVVACYALIVAGTYGVEAEEPTEAQQVREGIVDRQNLARYRELIPSQVVPLFERNFAIFVSPTLEYTWRRDDEFERLSRSETLKASPPTPDRLSSRGYLYGGASQVAREGVVDAARRALWDSVASLWAEPVVRADLALHQFSELRLERTLNGVYARVNTHALEPANRSIQVFRDTFRIQQPTAFRDWVWLGYRFLGDEEDAAWIRSPAIGALRQVSGSNRGDQLFGSLFSLDDVLGWSTKVESVEPRIVKAAQRLVPFARLQMSEWRAVGEQCVEVADTFSNERAAWNASALRFPSGAPWVPTGPVFVPQEVFEIETLTRDPYAEIGRELLIVHAGSMLPVYRFAYTQRGELKKTVINVIGLATAREMARKIPYLSQSVMIGAVDEQVVGVDYANYSVCRNYPPDVSADWFDPRKVAEVGVPVAVQTAEPSGTPGL